MPTLKKEHKELIIHSLACYMLPTEVQSFFRDEIGIEITYQQIAHYNADKSPRLSHKYRDLFESSRTAYLNEIKSIPISHKAFRLNKLQMLFDKMIGMNNFTGAQSILIDAAKEMHDFYGKDDPTNKIEPGRQNLYQQINNYLLDRENGIE